MTPRMALWSAVVTIVGLSNVAAALAQEARLGRLFFTPEERQKINEKRGVVSNVSSAPQTVIVNGMVVRSGQPPVLFIDGKESIGAASNASAARQLARGVPLKTESGRTIDARPGQVIDLASGRAIENYQLVPGVAESAPRESLPGAGTGVVPPAPSASDQRNASNRQQAPIR